MTALAAQLPPPVARYVRAFDARRKLLAIVRSTGLATLLTVAWVIAVCLVDRAVALPSSVRMAALVLNIAGVVWIIGRTIAHTLRDTDWLATTRQIERREPEFAERLHTLVSRLAGPTEYAGSRDLLEAIGQSLAIETRDRTAGDLLPWSEASGPWIASGLAALVFGLLMMLPVLDVPRLIERYLTPLADVAPAATSRLFVSPGATSIAQGGTLRVRAVAQRLGSGGLTLHVRVPGGAWTEQPMTREPDGTFEAGMQGIEHDLEYFVTGGDARSDTFGVALLRRPAVVAVRARLVAPTTGEVAARNAIIEAPAGSEAVLSVEASEPLASATLLVGGETIETQSTTQPAVREARLSIREDRRFMVRLRSAAGVDGFFRGGTIRAIPAEIATPPRPAATAPSRSDSPDSVPSLPVGYDAALKAYFDAIRPKP